MKRTDIEEKLLQVGMPADYIGLDFITEYILLLCEDKYRWMTVTQIYNEIGERYGRCEKAVYTAIHKALDTIRRQDSKDIIRHYFGDSTKNSVCLQHFFRMLRFDMEHGETRKEALA